MGGKGLFTPATFSPTVETTAFTLTAVSTLVVLIRFYCRISVVGKLKSYDFLIAAAVVCTWGLCVINHFQLRFGSGYKERGPFSTLPSSDEIRKAQKAAAAAWYAYQLVYLLVPALVKLSILVFYLSFATGRTFRILVYCTIGFVASFTVGTMLVNAFECPHKPSLAVSENNFLMRKQWKCLELSHLYYSQATLSLFSDVVIFILPLPVLVKLHMPTHRRICLLLVFSVGLLVPIAAGFRLWAIYLWTNAGWMLARYYGAYILFWDQVEVNTAIICASAPSLQPLFRCVFGQLSRFTRHRSAYVYYRDGQNEMTQRTIGRRGSRRPDIEVALTSPTSTYQPAKESSDVETGTVLIREIDVIQEISEEEEIRNRVRAFSARSGSIISEPPKSPAQPHDMLTTV